MYLYSCTRGMEKAMSNSIVMGDDDGPRRLESAMHAFRLATRQ